MLVHDMFAYIILIETLAVLMVTLQHDIALVTQTCVTTGPKKCYQAV